MNYKIGDRFEWWDGGRVWEIIDINHNISTVVRIIRGIHDVRSIGTWENAFFQDNGWTYLGNFNKSSNFSNLFEILNDGC